MDKYLDRSGNLCEALQMQGTAIINTGSHGEHIAQSSDWVVYGITLPSVEVYTDNEFHDLFRRGE